MRRVICLLLVFFVWNSRAQSIAEAAAIIEGLTSVEEMDEGLLAVYEDLAEHPVCINTASRSKLLASHLFSPYQVASLLDYRSRTGDVLSQRELSLVEGFNAKTVSALSPFISYFSPLAPGQIQKRPELESETTAAFISKNSGQSWAAKYKASYGDNLSLGLAARSTFDRALFQAKDNSFNITGFGRRYLGKLIIGDFNARFGQGLLIWNGMNVASLSELSSFAKRPSGLSPSFSYVARRGIAADFELGHYLFSSFYDFRERLAAVNLSRFMRNAATGISCVADGNGFGVSADWRLCLRGNDYFGETAWTEKEKLAAIAGARLRLGDNAGAALRLKWSELQSEAALGLEVKGWELTAQSHFKKDKNDLRLLCKGDWIVAKRLEMRLRAVYKADFYPELKQSHKYDLRLDCDWTNEKLGLCLRLNPLYCKDFAWLCYLEPRYKAGKVNLFLRGELFEVRNWEDRIYVYERDAPGNFNVPALYGRGYNISAYANCRIAVGKSLLKVYLRAAMGEYVRKSAESVSKQEFKFQLCYQF